MTTPSKPASAHVRLVPCAAATVAMLEAASPRPPPADGEFGEHQGDHDESQAQHVEQHKRGAAIGADLVRKLPDAADTDRRTDSGKNETRAARPDAPGFVHGRYLSCFAGRHTG